MPKKAIRLPKEFKKYFWDVDFKKVSLSRHLNLVLCRIMNFGNMKAIRWMMMNVDRRKIYKYLLSFGKRQLDKRSNNFWRLYFGLSHAK